MRQTICEHCGNAVDMRHVDALEPMLTLKDVGKILQRDDKAIKNLLFRHPEVPARYLKGRRGHRHRVLYASEVRYLRDLSLYVESGKKSPKTVHMFDHPSFVWTYPTIDENASWNARKALTDRFRIISIPWIMRNTSFEFATPRTDNEDS